MKSKVSRHVKDHRITISNRAWRNLLRVAEYDGVTPRKSLEECLKADAQAVREAIAGHAREAEMAEQLSESELSYCDAEGVHPIDFAVAKDKRRCEAEIEAALRKRYGSDATEEEAL